MSARQLGYDDLYDLGIAGTFRAVMLDGSTRDLVIWTYHMISRMMHGETHAFRVRNAYGDEGRISLRMHGSLSHVTILFVPAEDEMPEVGQPEPVDFQR